MIRRIRRENYTSPVLSGISAGIKVKLDKNQQATHKKIPVEGLLQKKIKEPATAPAIMKHQVYSFLSEKLETWRKKKT